MNRSSATGLLVFGIVLGVIGAIMRFAVTVTTEGFSIHTAGIILLFVGAATALVGLVMVFAGNRSRTVRTESVRNTPTGQVRTEERSDSGTDL